MQKLEWCKQALLGMVYRIDRGQTLRDFPIRIGKDQLLNQGKALYNHYKIDDSYKIFNTLLG